MHRDFTFKHNNRAVEVEGYYPRTSSVPEGQRVDPRGISEMLLAVKVDGQDFGSLPYRQFEDEAATKERVREYVQEKMRRNSNPTPPPS
jgi:hypothetical protein